MSIHKIKKHQDQIPYEMISREIAQSIENPVALAIWLYLLTKPEEWIVRRSQIKSHFGIGDISYGKALKQLGELGLYEKEMIRGEAGEFSDAKIHIYSTPKAHRIADNPNSGKPVHGSAVLPLINTLKENDISKEEESIKYNSVIEELFEQFWLAGLPKVNKKKALTVFKTVMKKQYAKAVSAEPFTQMLINDVKARLSANQFGFDKLHPERYLKNERWNDEITTNTQSPNQPESTGWSNNMFDDNYLET